MIHVCVSNGQTAASANLTGNRVIMSFAGVGGGGGGGLEYHCQVATRGKGGVLQYARGSKGGGGAEIRSRCSVMCAFRPSLHVGEGEGANNYRVLMTH